MLERPNRYEIHRPLEYKIRGTGGPVVGAGRTLNISRRGVLFHAEEDLKVGKRIELVVQMGSALGKGPDVNLVDDTNGESAGEDYADGSVQAEVGAAADGGH